MARMNPSKLRNVLEELPYRGFSGSKETAIRDIIEKYLDGRIAHVVRCGECIHYSPDGDWCEINSHFYDELLEDWNAFGEDDFCSFGERRDGE